MGIIKSIRDYINGRKQKKLDKSLEEKKQVFIQGLLDELESIANNEEVSQTNKMVQIAKVLGNNCRIAKQLGIISQNEDISELTNALGGKKEYKEAILYTERKDTEERIYFDFISGQKSLTDILEDIEKYNKDFNSSENEWKVISLKQKYDILKKIIEENGVIEDEKFNHLHTLKKKFENYYIVKLNQEKNPQILIKLYDEYLRDFINNDPEKVQEFRQYCKWCGIDNIIRKIDTLNEIGSEISYTSVDQVPVLYEELDEKESIQRNESLAQSLRTKEITADQLLFIRKTHIFPLDGVVEPIGDYSGMEYMDSPFDSILRRKYNAIDADEFEILTPRYRATSHWCINGIVGDHLDNFFTGDFMIIEEASEHKDNSQLLNVKAEDSIFLGDLKLSTKFKVMMSVKKYKELIQDEKMKKQLEKVGVILYRENPQKVLKTYMNDNGYVWGDISSWGYALGRSREEEAQTEYLTRISTSLASKMVQGFEKCASSTDEGLVIEDVKNPESREKMKKTVIKNNKIMEIEEPDKVGDDFQFRNTSLDLDRFLSYTTTMDFFMYLKKKLPDKQEKIQHIVKLYKEALLYYSGDEPDLLFERHAEQLIDEIGVDNLLEITKEFNKSQREKDKEHRIKKDKELLDKGMISKEEFYDRCDGGIEYPTD